MFILVQAQLSFTLLLFDTVVDSVDPSTGAHRKAAVEEESMQNFTVLVCKLRTAHVLIPICFCVVFSIYTASMSLIFFSIVFWKKKVKPA